MEVDSPVLYVEEHQVEPVGILNLNSFAVHYEDEYFLTVPLPYEDFSAW